MAKPPVAAAAPATAPVAADPTMDEDAAGGGDDVMPEDEGAGDGSEVILTVCKEADGTYSLIKGDEEEANGEDAAGAAATEGTPENENKQSFDSKGALLKGILDILNEGESSEGAEGTSEDQFQSGFGGGEGAPATAPAAVPAQKY